MKKIILTASVVVGLIGTSFGQGFIAVTGTASSSTNTSSTLTQAYAGGSAGGTAFTASPASSSFYMEVLTAAFTGTTNSTTLLGKSLASLGWLDTGVAGGNSSFAGRLTAGSSSAAANAPAGQVNQWLIVAWSTALGNWATVSAELASGNFTAAGQLGWSTVGIGAAGAAAPATPLALFGSGGAIASGFTMLATPAVPEPATIALAGLGGLALLALRRRTSK